MKRKEIPDFIAAVKLLRESADDKTASLAPLVYPTIKGEGALIRAGTRINWNGTVYRAAVDLWDNPGSDPDSAPTLWAELDYKDGIRKIHDPIPVTEAFARNEKGWWHDEVYVSQVDMNVYTPEQYAPYWQKDDA